MATRTARSVASRSPVTSTSRSPKGPAARAALNHSPAPPEPASLRLLPARAGDHPAVHAFLLSVFQGPTAAEFGAQLDEPGYLPSSRLVVKRGDEVLGHLRLARQSIHVGAAALPVVRFMDLATAPEIRGQGVATALLTAGERAAGQSGVLAGITRTRVPSLFARLGWSCCGGQTHSVAAPRAVLAEIEALRSARRLQQAAGSLFHSPEPAIRVRPLRRIELPALLRLYTAKARLHAGWPLRDEAHWDWLLARGACERIFVAARSPESGSFSAAIDAVVGYACVRQSRIVELVTAPGQTRAAEVLLERICADAREADGWTMRYDAPASDALHDLLTRAGGQLLHGGSSGDVCMVKLFDPLAVLRAVGPDLHRRACEAGLSLPLELGIDLCLSGSQNARKPGVAERFLVRIHSTGATVSTGGPSRHTVTVRLSGLTRLLLGDASGEELIGEGRLVASTPKAASLATALFPSVRWWRPIFDDLLA